jgi:GAF domain-containing protein
MGRRSVPGPGYTMGTDTKVRRASRSPLTGQVRSPPARTEVLRALHEIAVATGGVLNPPELARLVADRACELLDGGGAGLYLSDQAGTVLLPLHNSDANVAAPEPALPIGEGVVGQAFVRGEPVRVADDIGWENAGTRAPARRVRGALAVPLTVADRRIGALCVWSHVRRVWTDDDVRTLTVLAAQVAPVLEAARLHDEAERRAHDLTGLYRAEATLHRSLRVDGVLQALVDVATDLLRSDKTSVLVWDERHEALVVGAARGFSAATLARMRHGPGEGIAWLVATRGEPIAVPDAAADPRVVHAVTELEGIRSLFHAPIMRDGRVAGVFAVNYCQPRRFSGDEERLLLALAQQAALALDNAHLFDRERLNRERLELALEAGRMGTWEWDAGSNRVTWSPQLEAIHGLTPGTFAGTFDAYLADVHPDDLERVRPDDRPFVRARRASPRLPHRLAGPIHSLGRSTRSLAAG